MPQLYPWYSTIIHWYSFTDIAFSQIFPYFCHIFAIFSKWNWGILLAVRSPHRGNSLFFHCFSQGSEESVESRRSSSENVEWPHKRRKKWRNGAKTIFLGVPLYRWLVYFMEIPPKWTGWELGVPNDKTETPGILCGHQWIDQWIVMTGPAKQELYLWADFWGYNGIHNITIFI